ncbi:aldehyde dehydrogenase [Pollutimonas thiosulfatoxidans]|uniref:Aldehyde dehydrogenase n=1 Tax=Pollutimonas thiosulfatoxidans TaxID=2028345 RepID=A0A451FSH9_9BURK|nr:aldehyde dehydrogenase [Pollutimonas thiosulfatoxidans]
MDFGTDYTHTIAGRAVKSVTWLGIINPATEEQFAQAPDASKEQLDAAVSAARAAFPGWSSTPYEQRQALVYRIGDMLLEHQEQFARLLTKEQGKPLESARMEVGRAAHWCKEIAGFSLPETVLDSDPERTVLIRHVPLGVVGAIVPWNFPMTLALWKVAPGLLAGNTMVLKPSPFTPLTALKLGELLCDLLPPGVLNVVSGGDAVGPWMSEHEGIDKIAFTGSTATGRRVMESASRRLKRITLELGGNDPAIVLPDADIDEVAPQLFWACFANSSQYCLATKRLYIHESIYDRLASAIVEYGKSVKVGDGTDESVQLGPVQNRLQYERIMELLADCKAQGMRFLLGGDSPAGPGYFLNPTIVDNPPDDTRIVNEEPFGPIVPFLKYRTLDEVVQRANAGEYGLGGSVWGSDAAVARSVADRLQCGMIWINEIHKLTPHAPLAGHKQSGLGSENSLEGLLSYTNTQTLSVKR